MEETNDIQDSRASNRVELSMGQLAGLRRLTDRYKSGEISTEYFLCGCKSICPSLKEYSLNELVVVFQNLADMADMESRALDSMAK